METEMESDLFNLTDGSAGVVNIAIDMSEPEEQEKFQKRSQRKRPSAWQNAIKLSNETAISISGKVAEEWKSLKKRLLFTDRELIEHLLQIRQEYESVMAKCTRQSSRSSEKVDCSMNEVDKVVTETTDENNEKIETDEDPKVTNNDEDEAPRLTTEEDETNEEYIIETHNQPSMSPLSSEVTLEETVANEEEEIREQECEKKSKTKGYRCQLCHMTLKNGRVRKTHTLTEHFTMYVKCTLCDSSQGKAESPEERRNRNTVKLDSYFQHLKEVHDVNTLTCLYCKRLKFLRNLDAYKDHLLQKHPRVLLCKCNVCFGGEEINGNTDNDRPSPSIPFIRLCSVKGHIMTRHTSSEPLGSMIPCTICGALITAHSMAKHVQNVHTEKQPGQNNLCDLCGRSFINLKQHKMSVHKKKEEWKFQCKHCKKKFAKRYNMEVHMRLHTGEKPYVCEICGKAYCQNVELRIHIKNHHSSPSRRKEMRRRRYPDKHMWSPSRQVVLPATGSQIEFPVETNPPEETLSDVPQQSNTDDGDSRKKNQPMVLLPQKVILGQNQGHLHGNSQQSQPTMYAILSDLPVVEDGTQVTNIETTNFLRNITVLNITGDEQNLQAITLPSTEIQGVRVAQGNVEHK